MIFIWEKKAVVLSSQLLRLMSLILPFKSRLCHLPVSYVILDGLFKLAKLSYDMNMYFRGCCEV